MDLTDAAPSPLYPPVTSIAFLERDYSHTDLIATGAPDGTITLRTWNANNTPEGEKARWEFVTLKTLKVKSESRFRSSIPCVTALKFVGYAKCPTPSLVSSPYVIVANHSTMVKIPVNCTDGNYRIRLFIPLSRCRPSSRMCTIWIYAYLYPDRCTSSLHLTTCDWPV